MIDIANDENVSAERSSGNRRSRRKFLRRDDDATKQRAANELLRLEREGTANRLWVALLTFALAVITALTQIVPLVVQQYVQTAVPTVTTGTKN